MHERLLQLILRVLIDKFLVVGHNRLRNCLSDRVNLRCMTTTGDPDSDIDFCKFVETDYEERLVDLDMVMRKLVHEKRVVATLNRRISG